MTFEIYRTREGDSVDLIAFLRFGQHGMEAAILDANPYLAALGPILPANMIIWIPVPVVQDRQAGENLWGAGE